MRKKTNDGYDYRKCIYCGQLNRTPAGMIPLVICCDEARAHIDAEKPEPWYKKPERFFLVENKPTKRRSKPATPATTAPAPVKAGELPMTTARAIEWWEDRRLLGCYPRKARWALPNNGIIRWIGSGKGAQVYRCSEEELVSLLPDNHKGWNYREECRRSFEAGRVVNPVKVEPAPAVTTEAPAPVEPAPVETATPAPVEPEQIQNPNESKSQTVLNLTPASDDDIARAVREPVPEFDLEGEEHVGVGFINRMFTAEDGLSKRCGYLQWKMGKVLLAFKTQGPQGKHGNWLKFVEKHFRFTDQTARNWIEVAINCSEEDARTMTISDLYRKAGILPDPGEKRGRSCLAVSKAFFGVVEKWALEMDKFKAGRCYCGAIDQWHAHLPDTWEKKADDMIKALQGLIGAVEFIITDFKEHVEFLKRGGKTEHPFRQTNRTRTITKEEESMMTEVPRQPLTSPPTK